MKKAARRGESAKSRAERAHRIAAELARLYPQARISLNFETAWQCLAATILSAQCTDARVNKVTPALFRKYPDAYAIDAADIEDLQRMIVDTGFFRQKARALKASAHEIVERFGGRVPETMEDLLSLHGVGRKTANVVLGHVHGKSGMVVDTHVRRVSRRLGLTANADADKIEIDLAKLLPAPEWTPFSMRVILHGRQICNARRPKCEACALLPECPQIGVKRSRGSSRED